jgi:hypothetical protein
MPAFLDPTQPIATCTEASCEGCPAGRLVHCHFRGRDLAHFLLNALPTFAIGVAGIARVNGWGLLPWAAIAFGYFGLLEIRVMCSHCPHYAEPGTSLRCWANYGSPKLWRYRPGPMSGMETFWFFAGLVAVLGYPLVFLVLGGQWFLLLLYALTTTAAGTTLKLFLCTHCMNFACPLNEADDAARQAFFERNPEVDRAWNPDRSP